MKALIQKMSNTDLGLLLLRLSIGGLLLLHGLHKLIYGTGAIAHLLSAKGLPEIMAQGVIIGEFIAPLLIIIGLFTRPAAATVVFVMVMSIYLAFGWSGFKLTEMGGLGVELNLLYLLGALALVFTGAGRFAVSKNLWS